MGVKKCILEGCYNRFASAEWHSQIAKVVSFFLHNKKRGLHKEAAKAAIYCLSVALFLFSEVYNMNTALSDRSCQRSSSQAVFISETARMDVQCAVK